MSLRVPSLFELSVHLRGAQRSLQGPSGRRSNLMVKQQDCFGLRPVVELSFTAGLRPRNDNFEIFGLFGLF